MILVGMCVLLCACTCVCVLPVEGDYNKSCINIELNQAELTNNGSCRACMVAAANNSMLCWLLPVHGDCFRKVAV